MHFSKHYICGRNKRNIGNISLFAALQVPLAACWVVFSSSSDDSFALKRAICAPPPHLPPGARAEVARLF